MGLFSWLFGSTEEKKHVLPVVAAPTALKVDPRDVLASDEEWVTPEEWFTDTDGKRVKKKRKKAREEEEENVGGALVADSLGDVAEAVVAVGVSSYSEPVYTPPPAPDPTPSYSSPSYDSGSSYSSSYDSGSSSYDSGGSCDSGGCGGGCD